MTTIWTRRANNTSPIRDINTDSTGVIYGYRDLRATTGANTGTNNTVGALVTVDPGTGALGAVGNDNILGRNTNLVTQANDFEDVTISDFVGAVAIDRNAGPNQAANPVAYYAVHENTGSGNPATMFPNSKLYRANITTGAVENDTNDTGFGNIQLSGVTYADVTISVRDNATPAVRSDITVQARAPGTDGNGITIVIDYATDNTLDVTVSGTTITIEVDDANTAGEIATAINSDEEANRLVTALVNLNDAVGTVANNAGNPVFVSNGGVLSGGGGSPLTGNVTGMSFGNFYGSASGTTAQRRLYGITDMGEFIRISTSNGSATLIRDLAADFGLTGFQGLTLGPQNVAGGIYANLLFAIAGDGTLIALDFAGTPQTVFDSNGDGTLDADRIDTGVTNATGLAFGGADINLWHPTTRVPVDSDGNPVTEGRGINPAFDFSRTPSDEPIFVTDGQGNTTEYNHSEAKVESASTSVSKLMFRTDLQFHISTTKTLAVNLVSRNNDVHRDLSDVSGGGNNYNLPGGAAGVW